MARAHQETLAKPPHSLGTLEDISVQIAGLTGKVFNRADRRRVIVFASDNGVVEEGVASAPQSVTLAQTINISRGLTGVGVIAKHYHTELDVIDLGVNADFEYPGVLNEKIAFGTKNFAREPAMTRAQAERAMAIGISAVDRAARDGIQILGAGEMGIGNTSTSSAVLSALLNLPAEETVSRGGGVNDAGFLHKKEIIDSAIGRISRGGGKSDSDRNRRIHQRGRSAVRGSHRAGMQMRDDSLPRFDGARLRARDSRTEPGTGVESAYAARRRQRLPDYV